jgi:hypothetical protein
MPGYGISPMEGRSVHEISPSYGKNGAIMERDALKTDPAKSASVNRPTHSANIVKSSGLEVEGCLIKPITADGNSMKALDCTALTLETTCKDFVFNSDGPILCKEDHNPLERATPLKSTPNLNKWKRATQNKGAGPLVSPSLELKLGKRKGKVVDGVHELNGSETKKLRGTCEQVGSDKLMAETGGQPRQSP